MESESENIVSHYSVGHASDQSDGHQKELSDSTTLLSDVESICHWLRCLITNMGLDPLSGYVFSPLALILRETFPPPTPASFQDFSDPIMETICLESSPKSGSSNPPHFHT
ncbi:Hypothetical predicted protein, partial [Pelobates cultripes]